MFSIRCRHCGCEFSASPLLLRRVACPHCGCRHITDRMLALYLVLVLMTSIGSLFVYRASQLFGLPKTSPPFDLEQYGLVNIVDAENAFAEYDFASPTKDPEGIDDVLWNGWPSATPSVVEWLATNQEALQLLRTGAAKSIAVYCQPKHQSYETMIHVTKHRALSRLARLEAARLIDADDMAGAWNWYNAALRHSRHVGMYGAEIDRHTGVALHSFVMVGIIRWAADSRTSDQLLRQALEDSREAYQLTQPLSTTLRSEYFFTMNTMNQVFESQPIFANEERPGFMALFLANEPTLGKRTINLAYANWLSQVDLPLIEQSPRCPGELRLFESEIGPLSAVRIEQFCRNSPVATRMIGRGCPLVSAIRREQSKQLQLEIVLAAQWYFRDHGRFPESSSDFSGNYLAAWPADPLSSKGSPMRYQCNNTSAQAVVWSVGPNGTDDGGNVDVQFNAVDFDLGMRIQIPR